MHTRLASVFALGLMSFSALAQPGASDNKKAPDDKTEAQKKQAEMLAVSLATLVNKAEGDNKCEWPYEGVYRVNREIPMGYRIGGTAIVIEALAQSPSLDTDQPRKDAIARGLEFICKAREHPTMSEADYDGGYDVRAWGYIYGLHAICRLKTLKLMPAEQAQACDKAAAWFLDALQKTEIPGAGGWNYARPPGRKNPGNTSPFMTGPALQALFEAKVAGMTIDDAVVERALKGLERGRTPAGSVQYAARDGASRADATPGAVGRMLTTEATLYLAGRGSLAQVRGAIDAFIVHWKWLDQRRAKPGTHEGPYAIAPYYFMFAHHAAAQAVELLPQAERAEYRRRINELLLSVRGDDNLWNDRVFARSGSYSTAMALLAIHMPDLKPPATWKASEKAKEPEAKAPGS